MSDAAVTWKVTSQTPSSKPDETGRFVQGMLVSFAGSNGIQGTIFVPESQYSADIVRQRIAEKVANMTEIQNLQG